MRVESAPPIEINKDNCQFDAIIVLGAGIAEKNGKFQLGFFGKMRAIAAAEAYRQEFAPVLVLTGGKTQGEEKPSESQLTWEFLNRKYQQEAGKFSRVPEKVIYLEEESKDTAANFENVLLVIQENGWRQVAVLTNDFHLKRAAKIAQNFCLDVIELSAEDLLRLRDRRFAGIIDSCYQSATMKSLKKKEKIPRAM